MSKKIIFILLCSVFACLPVGMVLAKQININTATLSQLDELTGVGATYAQRIIDGRPYSSVDDLDRVKGIGPATIQKIKEQGFACVNCLPAQAGETSTTSVSAPTATYPSGVYINEILPNPAGADETEEWVELYNSNNFEVDLTGWQIKDATGTPTTFTVPKNTEILSNSFLIFRRPETKIMLNNEQDGLTLLTPDKKVVDSVNFSSAPLGQSYGKTASGWSWSTNLTPEAKNIIMAVAKTVLASAKSKVVQTDLSKTENSVKNSLTEAGLANVSQTANPWFLFFSALVITMILAFSVLFIKLKFQKNVRT